MKTLKQFCRFTKSLYLLTIFSFMFFLFSCEKDYFIGETTSEDNNLSTELASLFSKNNVTAIDGILQFETIDNFFNVIEGVNKLESINGFDSIYANFEKVLNFSSFESKYQTIRKEIELASDRDHREYLQNKYGDYVKGDFLDPTILFTYVTRYINEDRLIRIGNGLHKYTDDGSIIVDKDEGHKIELFEKNLDRTELDGIYYKPKFDLNRGSCNTTAYSFEKSGNRAVRVKYNVRADKSSLFDIYIIVPGILARKIA